MSISEQLKEDQDKLVGDLKVQISENLHKLKVINKQLELNKNEAFQEWMKENIRDPFNAAVATHMEELDTNKSFRGKGILKTYQKVLGWTQRKEEEVRRLNEQIDSMNSRMKEDTNNSQRPEV